MSLATLLFTTPSPRYVPTSLQNVAALIASRPIAHMRTPHIQWERSTLDLDDLGRHILEIFSLEAIEIWVGVVRLDGISGSGVGICGWCACHEARKPPWWPPRWAAHGQSVDRVLGLSLAERIKVRHS
jgi:hypothetical protein